MSKKCCEQKIPERLNKVGGQAVLEGVMMKAGETTVTTCRKDDGSLVVVDSDFVSVRKKHKFLNIPILRGVVNFIESLILSMKTLSISADALGLDEEEEEGKVAKWMKKHLGLSVTDAVMAVAMVLGVALSLFLFMFLPTAATNGVKWLWANALELGDIHPSVLAVIEGLIKVGIFLLYLILVSLMPDIKRTFMYHGAEHKSIACFEAGAPLTPSNAKEFKRFHPRCGTSFMFLMILLGIFAGMFVRNILPANSHAVIIALVRLAILPLIMGIGYEILMIAGKHDNLITRIISAPGLWVQRITTKEPTEDMLEVAIISLKCALRNDFPEFKEFYEGREWESHASDSESDAEKDAELADGNGDSDAKTDDSVPDENGYPSSKAEDGASDVQSDGSGADFDLANGYEDEVAEVEPERIAEGNTEENDA